MEFKLERALGDINLDDEGLINEMNRLKDEVEDTQRWVEELENEQDSIDYIDIKMAKLAFGFAREKYQMLSEEAHRRGLLH